MSCLLPCYFPQLAFSHLYWLIVCIPVTSSDGDSGVDGLLREGRAVSVSARVQERRRDQHGVFWRQWVVWIIWVKLLCPLMEWRNKCWWKCAVHTKIRRTQTRRVEYGVGRTRRRGAFGRRASGFQQTGLCGTRPVAGFRLHAMTAADGDHRSKQNEGQEGAHYNHEGQISGNWRNKDKKIKVFSK